MVRDILVRSSREARFSGVGGSIRRHFPLGSKETFLALRFARVIKECQKNAIGRDARRPKLSVLRRKT
jgi:hypothetical protein